MNSWNIISSFYKIRNWVLLRRILEAENNAARNLLSKYIVAGSVLDLGSGLGNASKLIPGFKGKLIGIERSPGMIKRNPENYRLLINADALKTPLAGSSINIILCIGLSEYIPDSMILLNEIHRLLDENGLAVYTSSPKTLINVLRKIWNNKMHLRQSNYECKTIAEAGFEILGTSRTLMQNQYLIKKI